MSTINEDFTLLNECISGKKEAWDLFVDRYSNLIYHSILGILKNYSVLFEHSEVEDIYHSIFLSLIEKNYRKLRQYEGRDQCTFTSWIQVISKNHTINFIKAQKHHVSLDDDKDETRPLIEKMHDNKVSVPDQMESMEDKRIIKKAINDLPLSDRLFMKLYYVKELPPDEIANIMNVSVNTIYSKKKRTPEKIEKILKKKGIIARKSE
ncbi:MAG: RNA polymerase sigma factor [Promethearchaeota archaeon]|jgi:RNA polymerase sigma-70 factor (ECF subfamily)